MFEIPRGTRDFTSEEMQKRRFVENDFRTIFMSFGYKEVQTPTFENLDLFTIKSGESIIDEIYSFEDKGGRKLALRPELTAPVIRMYVDKLQMEPKPLKLFYFGNCYRYDRPQKGRYREFMQAGCELIGTKSSEAIAELISMAYTLINHVGVQNIQLQIGNLKLLKLFFKKINLNEEQRKQLLPLIDKELYDGVEEILQEFGYTKEQIKEYVRIFKNSSIEQLTTFFKDDEEAHEEINRLKQVLQFIKNCFDIKEPNLHMGIVRGLDYYTGIVFEIKAPSLGAEKQICGGGEYDLVPLFEGRPTPTSGFAIGFDRTILAMDQEKATYPTASFDYYIIPVNEEMIETALNITMKLRKEGKIVDIDLMKRGIGKAMKYASSKNTKSVIIIGPDEVKQKAVTIRDMETGKQGLYSIDTLKPI